MNKLRTTAIMTVLLISPISLAYGADNYVGIILDGHQNNCTVQSGTEIYDCTESRHLIVGDKLIKKPDIKDLKIKWAPYSSGTQLDNTTLLVVFKPPKNKKGVVEQVKEFFGFVKTGHNISIGATRRTSQEPRITQPNNNATVLRGQKITFVKESGIGKHLVLKDSKGNVIFKKETSRNSLQLSPDEIGMKPSEVYLWDIEGVISIKEFKIRLIDDEMSQQIAKDISQIDEENINEDKKRLKKAGYMQLLSSTYPDEVNLYWLSYRLLEDIKATDKLNEEEQVLLKELRKNYMKHIYN